MVYQLDPKSAEKLAEMEEKRFGNKLLLEVGVPRQVIFQEIKTEIRRAAGGDGEYMVIYLLDAITGKQKEMVTTSFNLITKLLNDLQISPGDLFSIEKTNRRGADYYKIELIARDEKNLELSSKTPVPKLKQETRPSNERERYVAPKPPKKEEPINDEAISID